MKLERRTLVGLAIGATVIFVVFALPALGRLWVDASWFATMGHTDVYFTPLWAKLGLGLVTGLLVSAWVGGHLWGAVRITKGQRGPIYLAGGDSPLELDVGQAVTRLTWPVSLVIGLLSGLGASGGWRLWLLFSHGRSFGEIDPLFGRDVSFYVFTLPFLHLVFNTMLVATIASLVATTAMYAGRGGLKLNPVLQKGIPGAIRSARIHLSAIGAILFLVLAFGAWLASADLVTSQQGLTAGAGYTDVNARLPMIRAHLAVAVIAAVLVGISATRKRLVLIGAGVVLYAAVGLLGRAAYPAIVQTYVVEPNEFERETPYIEREIAATRTAYGLDASGVRELSGDLTLTRSDVDANRATIDNVRLWDHEPLLDTFGQIQEIRTYYDFVSVDNDRYVVDGSLRQTMLSARELSSSSLPNRTWITEHFTFTHGYGITLGPVNEADDEGLPRLFLQDIPPVSTTGDDLSVDQPAIYFGELSNDYVFVGTDSQEFDHPSANENIYADYEGPAGVALDSIFFRAALAVHTGSFKVLFSDDLGAGSRVLLHRRITDRVRLLAPFVTLDDDPYMVLREDGTLIWIVDAYTTTSRYPYSRAANPQLSYMRNSLKVVVDAYTGEVTLYENDSDDPILATWRSIFPDLLTPMSEMPADIRAHLRYPIDIFHVQARMLATFHMDRAELLYNREDQWEVPTLRRGDGASPMEPYYTVMRLPGEEDAEFILMLPFVPARKDNLAAWMVARSDGEHLGELLVYRFPNDRLVYGPQQVLNRVHQDAHISQQLSLWDQRGSQADFGTLLVIPIEESLIYVLPMYLRSEGGRIPQLKRVIVVYDDQIAMGVTLDDAVAEIFGPGDGREPSLAGAVATAVPATDGEDGPDDSSGHGDDAANDTPAVVAPTGARSGALAIFERAVAAQRRGDWATYGEELERLEAALRRLDAEPASPVPVDVPVDVPVEAPATPPAIATEP